MITTPGGIEPAATYVEASMCVVPLVQGRGALPWEQGVGGHGDDCTVCMQAGQHISDLMIPSANVALEQAAIGVRQTLQQTVHAYNPSVALGNVIHAPWQQHAVELPNLKANTTTP